MKNDGKLEVTDRTVSGLPPKKYEIHEADCDALAVCCSTNHECQCSGSRMVAVDGSFVERLRSYAIDYHNARGHTLWLERCNNPQCKSTLEMLLPFRAETEGLFNVVTSPSQPRDTISLIQVKDGKAVEVGRIENVRAETEENDKYDLSRGD